MMHGKRNLLWLLPLLFILGWPLYGAPLRDFLRPPELREEEAAAEEAGRRFTMEQARLYQDQAGVRQWRIDTPRLQTGATSDELLLGAVAAILFRDGQEHLRINAERGRYDTVAETLYLDDNVEMRGDDGFLLTTPALVYHEPRGMVSSRAGVEVHSAEARVRAENLDYDLGAGHYQLSGQVLFITP